MRIKDKKTGKIVEIPQHLEGEVEKAIAAGVDPITILGADLKKAQNGLKQRYPDFENRFNQQQLTQPEVNYNIGDFNKMPNLQMVGQPYQGYSNPEINLGNTQPNYYDFNTGGDNRFNFQPRDEGAELNQTQFPQEYNQQQNFPLRPQEPTYQMDKLPKTTQRVCKFITK